MRKALHQSEKRPIDHAIVQKKKEKECLAEDMMS